MKYFSRDNKFDDEKPFILSFPVDGIPGAVSTNHEFVHAPTRIQALRALPTPRLDTEGFTYLLLPTQLSYDDFASDENVCTTYFDEITAAIRTSFPHYKEIVYVDHQIRRRSPLFQAAGDTQLEPGQPSDKPHVDFTPDGAATKIRGSLGATPGDANELLQRDYDVLNVWRLLCTATPDWPLAFCDARSVDEDEDPIKTDVVYEDAEGEMYMLRHNPGHRWYFLQDQTLDEVWLWRNTDAHGVRPKAFHTSFNNPLVNENSPLRQSIEVRFAAFY